MSADFTIHVMENITEEDIAVLESNTFGSKYFLQIEDEEHRNKQDEIINKILKTPQYFIGEVSWLKAGLFQDPEKYVPDSIQLINDLIGENLPICDNELIYKILEAAKVSNNTSYEIDTNYENLKSFLKQHKGKKLFTMNW